MRLFLDDTREFPTTGYQCCRDSQSAIMLLSVMKFDYISLDYNLGTGGTGMDVLLWMQENGVHVPHINIHSDHILGREKMRDFCWEHFPDTKVTMNAR